MYGPWVRGLIGGAGGRHAYDAATPDGGPWCSHCGIHRARMVDGLCPVCDDDTATRERWLKEMSERDMNRRLAALDGRVSGDAA